MPLCTLPVLPTLQAMELYLVWDSESEITKDGTLLDNSFKVVDGSDDSSDSTSSGGRGKKRKRRDKKTKKKKRSSSSQSDSED